MGLSVPILVLVVSITNMIAGKLILGEDRKKIYETSGKYIYLWGTIILLTIGFGCLFFLDISDLNVMKWLWLCFSILTVGFYTFLEWMFLKESKEYIVSLIVLTVGLIYTLIFIF